jgi:hypothetical protein
MTEKNRKYTRNYFAMLFQTSFWFEDFFFLFLLRFLFKNNILLALLVLGLFLIIVFVLHV